MPTTTNSHAVFAYGSNMHMGDLARWHREHDRRQPAVRDIEVAVLRDYELCWNFHSATRDSGAANVRPRPGSRVTGLLLQLDPTTFQNLDDKEGYPNIYGRSELRLHVGNAARSAWVYSVTPAHRRDGFVAPLRGYRQLMLDTAQQYDFGQVYIRELLQVEVVD